MTHWHNRFLQLAKHVSSWSKDPSTKIGAVIVNPETQQVISMGYNGFPRGVEDSTERLSDREIKYKLVVHGELNAILNANQSVRGYDIYVYPTLMIPNSCPECSKAIVQSGIKRIYGYKNDNIQPRWQELAKYSDILLREGGVEFIMIEEQ